MLLRLRWVCYQLGCGGVSVDYLAVVASFPKPDDKIRSTSFQVISSPPQPNLFGEKSVVLKCTLFSF